MPWMTARIRKWEPTRTAPIFCGARHMPFHVGPVQPVKKVALSSNNVRLQCAEGLSIHGLVDPQAWAGAHPQAATTATFW